MQLLRASIVLLFTLLSIGKPCTATEMSDRQDTARIVLDAYAHERFTDMTNLADLYRVKKSRTASGLWKLTGIYVAMDQAIAREAARKNVVPAFRAIDAKMTRWTTLQPNSPVAHLAYAHALMRHAWAICGCGSDSTTTPEELARFHALIEETRRYLEKNKAVAAVDPHWYQMMLEIARLQAWDAKRFGMTFNEAIAREPLFYETYFAALDYLLPSWQGNVKDAELFAQFAADKTAATQGAGMYARIYWYASQSEFGDAIFEDSLAKWPKMKAGFDAILADYPDAWNYNNYGKFACLAKDKKSTREFFTKMGNQPIEEAWGGQALFATCRAWAMSGAL